MDRNEILEGLRNEMVVLIEAMDFDNLYDTQNHLEKYFSLLEQLGDLPVPSSAPRHRRVDSEKKGEEGVFGEAHLKLGGAEIQDHHIFIPENLVRKLDIHEGDVVRASAVENRYVNGHTKTIYEYEVLDRSKRRNDSNRELVSFAQVDFDDTLKEYFIFSSEDLQDQVKIILSDHKMGNLTLHVGDIVDYAYWNDDILNGRVIWKHNFENGLFEPLPRGSLTEEIFIGSRVGIMGEGPRRDEFVSRIRQTHSELEFIREGNNYYQLEEIINGLDVVVVFIEEISQGDLKRIQDVARDIATEILYVKKAEVEELLDGVGAALQNQLYD
ncbi:MAG: hypothetical protein Q4E76_05940 [Tissierellia bacterium]|nr:hypothetical protein [Tissierellia bacterium]